MARDKQNEVLFEEGLLKSGGPVECLGMTFENDDARREHFLGVLREKLKDPEFRKTEGFPIGEDEDILALSDPPYYTACPNPFIREFVKLYGKPYDPGTDNYHREPFAVDVSAGKNDSAYNLHAYPTKVPPDAILPLVEHYTAPGDTILDPFSGTGMTGVAANRLSNLTTVLQDLSPCATHIAYSICSRSDLKAFENISSQILGSAHERFAWMYETSVAGKKREVRYYIWSDVYICASCSQPLRIWDVEGGESTGGLKSKKPCPSCGALTSKQSLKPVTEKVLDRVLGIPIERIRSVPVMKVFLAEKGLQKEPIDSSDIERLEAVEKEEIPFPVPTAKMLFKDGIWGDQWRSSYHLGVTHAHHFYTYRNLWILSAIWHEIQNVDDSNIKRILLFWFTASLSRMTRLNRYMAQHNRHVGPLAGTLFIGPIQAEISPFYFLKTKLEKISSAPLGKGAGNQVFVSTASSTVVSVEDSSIDYIFTDPPFGDNLMYSELNFLVEAWLRVYTAQEPEAVVAVSQKKSLFDFQKLIEGVFIECHRSLKPGRWMTVEFHNTRSSVWNAIQEAIQRAGFVVADVRTLDKQKGTTKQLTQFGTVKQDLIISAYKPNSGLEERFKLEAGTEEGAWDFIRTHLKQLPVFVSADGKAEVIAERQNYLLFDRMVAFHVQRGVTVPLSAGEFYAGLTQRFPERDGMFFLTAQAAEYDKKRMKVAEVVQLELFVTDESSAIQWLKQQLIGKPQTFQELHAAFMIEIAGWERHEKPLELLDLLNENFLLYDRTGDVPPQIHSYLSSNYKDLRKLEKDDPALKEKAKWRYYVPDPNKAQDLEKLRERSLLREFEEYRQAKTKKLKVFRVEAVRAGFKKAWQDRDYDIIIAVAQKIPESVLQNDAKLLMWYDQARTRAGSG